MPIQDVIPLAPVQVVGNISALQEVVPRPPAQLVITVIAFQVVISGPPVQDVIPQPTEQGVIASQTIQRIKAVRIVNGEKVMPIGTCVLFSLRLRRHRSFLSFDTGPQVGAMEEVPSRFRFHLQSPTRLQPLPTTPAFLRDISSFRTVLLSVGVAGPRDSLMAGIRPRSLAYAPKDDVNSKPTHSIRDTHPTVRAGSYCSPPLMMGIAHKRIPRPLRHSATFRSFDKLRTPQAQGPQAQRT